MVKKTAAALSPPSQQSKDQLSHGIVVDSYTVSCLAGLTAVV